MLTIGTRFYPASGDSGRRQQLAREALNALADVHRVNLQFTDETFRPDGFDTRAVLRLDSRRVTGGGRVRKPIVPEMFDALAAAAAARGDRYFAYVNADIEVTPAAVARIVHGDRDAYAFCRTDLAPGTRETREVLLLGLDCFAADVSWWRRERRRFRPYIAGEALWDNVYAAVMASHGRAEIVDLEPGVYHEQHPASWGGGLFAEYNGCLAALDAPYFSRWAHYVAALQSARDGASLDRDRLRQEICGGPLLPRIDVQRPAVLMQSTSKLHESSTQESNGKRFLVKNTRRVKRPFRFDFSQLQLLSLTRIRGVSSLRQDRVFWRISGRKMPVPPTL